MPQWAANTDANLLHNSDPSSAFQLIRTQQYAIGYLHNPHSKSIKSSSLFQNKQWRFFGVWCLVGARVWFMFQANYWEITRSSWYIVCLFMIDHIHLYLWFSNVYTICKQSDNQPVKWYNLLHLCIWDVMPWCLKWWRINNCLVHSVNINKINCMWSTTCITVFWCCCFRNDSIKLWT